MLHFIFNRDSGEEYYRTADGTASYDANRRKSINLTIKGAWNVEGLHKAIKVAWGLPRSAAIECSYQADPADEHSWTAITTPASFRIAAELCQQRILAEGLTVHCCIHFDLRQEPEQVYRSASSLTVSPPLHTHTTTTHIISPKPVDDNIFLRRSS